MICINKISKDTLLEFGKNITNFMKLIEIEIKLMEMDQKTTYNNCFNIYNIESFLLLIDIYVQNFKNDFQ